MTLRNTDGHDPGYRVEPLGGSGVRYVLPSRKLIAPKTCAIVVTTGLVFCVGVPALSVVGAGLFSGGLATMFGLVALLFSLAFVFVGGIAVVFGVLARLGSSVVTVRGDEVESAERVRPIAWKRRLRADEIGQLEVHQGGAKVNGETVTEGPLAEVSALLAKPTDPELLERIDKKDGSWRDLPGMFRYVLAVGYPKTTLEMLAAEISEALGAHVGSTSLPVRVVKVEDEEEVEVLAQPASSDAAVTREPGHVTIRIRGAGWRAMKGLFIGIPAFIALFIVPAGVSAVQLALSGSRLGLTGLALLLFVCVIGVVLWRWALAYSKRTTVIDLVSGDVLITEQVGPKTKSWAILADNIISARIGDNETDADINNKPVRELQIRERREGKKPKLHCFFSDRDDDEIRWIASEIRQMLPPRA